MTDEKLAQVRELIREAGEALLSLHPGLSGDNALKSERKADGSLVTEADFKSDAILVEGLSKLFPKALIVSEERVVDYTDRSDTDVWILDPLDGTSRFAAGHNDFGILVAHCSSGSVTNGFMYFPAQAVFVEASSGGVAHKNCSEGEGVVLQVSGSEVLQEAKSYFRIEGGEKLHASYREYLDSGIALYKLACGELDSIIFRLNRLKEWDLAAPSCVIQAAGGTVTDEDGGRIRFGESTFPYQYFVASNGKCHQEVLDLVRSRQPE